MRGAEKDTHSAFTDYARELDRLVREERARMIRILRRIDESMTAVNETRRIVSRLSEE